MQFVQAESHTQCAQIACYTSPAQVWSDMQPVTHSTIQSRGEPPIRLFLNHNRKKPKNHNATKHLQCKPCASAKKCSCHEALRACISMHPKACKATEFWQYGRRSCFVTFLVLIPKLAIRVRRDEANGHNDSSRSSMPRHASESKWTWMHVSASSWRAVIATIGFVSSHSYG